MSETTRTHVRSSRIVQAVALAALCAAACSEARAQNAGGGIAPSAAGTDASMTTNAAPANGPSVNFNVGSGMNGVSANGIWPYGVAPNATEPNVFTARPAPPVADPALIPNFDANVNSGVTFGPNADMNSSAGANFDASLNGLNNGGAWLYYFPPQNSYRGAGAGAAYRYSQVSAQSASYRGRTFARGSPTYFGIRQFYYSPTPRRGYRGR